MVKIGSRIRDPENFRGTVRYIGPVAVAKDPSETWLGIEWDSPGRGKHDGSCVDTSGVLHRYFKCLDGYGSFVKPSKVTLGRSFVDVLKERYVEENAPITAPDNIVPNAFVLTSKGHQKSIELLGEQKLRKWQQISKLNKIAIRNDSIGFCTQEIVDYASQFNEIDLQENLIFEWIEIANFSLYLPSLQSILLHGNKLQMITNEIALGLPAGSFSNLKVLALNGCNIQSWMSFLLLEKFLTNLEELYLSSNCLEDMPSYENDETNESSDESSEIFPSLKTLDVSGCKIYSWNQVLYLGNISKLTDLRLDDNPISLIKSCVSGKFKNLNRLSISSTKLSNWSCIDKLASYTSCSYFRISHIPLFTGKGASEVRPIIIARLPALIFFNGSPVNSKERYEAEKTYIRMILREMNEHSSSSKSLFYKIEVEDQINKEHPRFSELKSKYETDFNNMTASSSSDSNTLSSELILITFKNLSLSSGSSLEPLSKKLPLSLTLSKLRLIVKQLFNIDINSQILSARASKDSIPIVLDDDVATLRYFGLEDGAEIFVNGIDC